MNYRSMYNSGDNSFIVNGVEIPDMMLLRTAGDAISLNGVQILREYDGPPYALSIRRLLAIYLEKLPEGTNINVLDTYKRIKQLLPRDKK